MLIPHRSKSYAHPPSSHFKGQPMSSSKSSATIPADESLHEGQEVKKDSAAEPITLEATLQGSPRFDGGARAWCTVVGAWLVQFSIISLPLSFGVMESFYAQEYLAKFTPSQINWIGSIQLCFMFLLGLSVARIFDAGYFHWIAVPGSFLFVFSIFMLSLAKPQKYYQIFLSQGLGMGIATGVLYTPVSSNVAHHFRKRRGLAMGIITTGSSLGGFFFSTILGRFLNGSIGFMWGVRICAFICLACLTAANLLMRTNYATKPPTNAPIQTPLSKLVKIPAYIAFIVFAFTVSLGLYNPMFSVELFSRQEAHVSTTLGSYLLAIINISSTFGRILPNYLADRYGVLPVYIPCTAAAGILALVMTLCKTSASIIIFCVLYGFFSGALVSLFFPAVLSLDPDVTRSGLHLSLASVPVGIASLIGTPIAAALVGRNGRWWAGSVFRGVLELVSAALLLFVYLTKPKQ